MQRRTFLTALAAVSLHGRALAQHAGHGPPRGLRPLEVTPPLGAKFSRPLRMPRPDGMMAWRDLPGLSRLQARISSYPVFSGGVTPLWVYAQGEGAAAIANPILMVQRGGEIDITLSNQLGDDTTIHWHGLMVDEANDGSGLHPVRHEDEYRYRFKVHNRAGLYWYHAHPHGRTGEQVHKGLAGLLLVDDAEDQKLRHRLGLEFGVNDLALMIADKQLGRANSIKYGLGEEDWIGNRVVVNWVPEPYFEATPRLYRLRILNAANARVFRLAFMHEGKRLPYTLIGTDGGLLERPQRIDDLFLGNAQRVDVLLDLSGLKAGDEVLMTSPAYDPMENEGLVELIDPMLEHPGATPVGEALDLMQIRVVDGPRVKTAKLPRRLSRLPKLTTKAAKAVRPLKLWVRDDGRWLINDWNFHLSGHDPVFTVQRGTQEIWEFTNAMRSMPHAMHTHGVQFRVIERKDSPKQVRDLVVATQGRTAHDLGLLDTVLVWPGETVRVLVDFNLPFPGTHRYMLHCHNLEHEDQGMMVTFAVGEEREGDPS